MSRIREKRLEKNWTQDMLAHVAGLSTNSICNYEKGNRSPKVEDMQKIARALNCSVGDLIESEVSK